MDKKNIICSFLISLLILNISFTVYASEKNTILKEFGVFTGLYKGSLKGKGDYELIPVGLKLGFDIEHFLLKDKENLDTNKSIMEFMVEPYIGGIISPDTNFETGFGLLLKYGYKIGKFVPFLQTGVGFQYSTQHVREESTQWNFQVQGGAGIHYFFKENKAINLEYRARHFSNASIKSPNTGVDLESILLGISYFF